MQKNKNIDVGNNVFLYSLESTYYEIPYDKYMRALVFSDFHIGLDVNSTKSISSIFQEILNLIIYHEANTLFILGDNIEDFEKQWKNDIENLINTIEQLNIKTYLISGNHDRRVLDNFIENKKFSNLIFIKDYSFFITHPNPLNNNIKRIFFGHDFGNSLWLNSNQNEYFIKGLKKIFSNMINKEDYLIIGHTHKNLYLKNDNCASIDSFSFKRTLNSYAFVTFDENININFFQKPFNYLIK